MIVFKLSGLLLSFAFTIYLRLFFYYRLTGIYAFVVIFHMTLFRGFKGGTIDNVPNLVDGCREAWWRNLLYITNFFTDVEYSVRNCNLVISLRNLLQHSFVKCCILMRSYFFKLVVLGNIWKKFIVCVGESPV